MAFKASIQFCSSSLSVLKNTSPLKNNKPNALIQGLSGTNKFFGTQATMYDVAIIGGGPGGYVAAIRAAQQGLKTVCIDKRSTLGGTCLNVGCIPSKILLNVSHKYHDALHLFPKVGIKSGPLSMDLAILQKEKYKSMQKLMQGILGLFKMNKVDFKQGEAQFESKTTLKITDPKGVVSSIEAKNIVIATGSESSPLPGTSIVPDEKVILTSTGALELTKVPKSMIVIGAGVIGLELGSVYGRLGSQIRVVEFLDRICPGLDLEIAQNFQKILKEQGFEFNLGTRVTNVTTKNGIAQVHVEDVKKKTKQVFECEKVLVAVGRRPFTARLNLDSLGIKVDSAGRIIVDDQFKIPNISNVYALGDAIRGPMLAHKAEDEGIAVADIISGKQGHVNYNVIPSVIYTNPEVAGVGETEDKLKEMKIKYKKGIFPFAANSRAHVTMEMSGLVKILSDATTDKILGAWIIGPNAGELIHELALGIEYGASSEDIARVCHAHPTLSEAVREACMATYGKSVHYK